MKFLNPSEAIKRLAAAQGIDVLNLIKSDEELQMEMQMQQMQAMEMEQLKQTPNMMKAPMLDPSKNPEIANAGEQSAPTQEGPPQEA